MTVKTYKIWEVIIRFAVCGIVTVSVIMGYWIPLFVSIIAAITIFIVMRFKVKGIVEDERTNVVMQKATSFSFTLGTFVTALAGAILVSINRENLSSTPAVIGYTLFFTSFGYTLIRDIAYYVISSRFSGKAE